MMTNDLERSKLTPKGESYENTQEICSNHHLSRYDLGSLSRNQSTPTEITERWADVPARNDLPVGCR